MAFGEDEDGEIYPADFSSGDGTIYRIFEIPAAPLPDADNSGGGGGCFIAIAAFNRDELGRINICSRGKKLFPLR